jgi:hypothetical protein
MNTIAQQIREERALWDAPRVHMTAPEMLEAVDLALAHARAHLVLPAAVPMVWCAHPAGHRGETWWFHEGRFQVCINAGLDLSPRAGRRCWCRSIAAALVWYFRLTSCTESDPSSAGRASSSSPGGKAFT